MYDKEYLMEIKNEFVKDIESFNFILRKEDKMLLNKMIKRYLNIQKKVSKEIEVGEPNFVIPTLYMSKDEKEFKSDYGKKFWFQFEFSFGDKEYRDYEHVSINFYIDHKEIIITLSDDDWIVNEFPKFCDGGYNQLTFTNKDSGIKYLDNATNFIIKISKSNNEDDVIKTFRKFEKIECPKRKSKIIRKTPLSMSESKIKKILWEKFERKDIVKDLDRLLEKGYLLDLSIDKLMEGYFRRLKKDQDFDEEFIYKNEGKIRRVLVDLIWDKIGVETVIFSNSLLGESLRERLGKKR